MPDKERPHPPATPRKNLTLDIEAASANAKLNNNCSSKNNLKLMEESDACPFCPSLTSFCRDPECCTQRGPDPEKIAELSLKDELDKCELRGLSKSSNVSTSTHSADMIWNELDQCRINNCVSFYLWAIPMLGFNVARYLKPDSADAKTLSDIIRGLHSGLQYANESVKQTFEELHKYKKKKK